MAVKHYMQGRAAVGLEVTPGTPVAGTMELPLTDDLLGVEEEHGYAEVNTNSSFPSVQDQVGVGVTRRLSWAPYFTKANCRDLVLMGTKRTNKDLSTFTVPFDQFGHGLCRFEGCMVSETSFSMQKGATPGAENIIVCRQSLEVTRMTEGQPGSYPVLTVPVSKEFQFRQAILTINSVAHEMMFGLTLTLRQPLSLGPVDPTDSRKYIIAGRQGYEISVSKAFESLVLKAMATAQSEQPNNSIVLATGVANETITFAMGKLKVARPSFGNQDGIASEEIRLLPYHTGAADQIVITFGSSIPASIMGQ